MLLLSSYNNVPEHQSPAIQAAKPDKGQIEASPRRVLCSCRTQNADGIHTDDDLAE